VLGLVVAVGVAVTVAAEAAVETVTSGVGGGDRVGGVAEDWGGMGEDWLDMADNRGWDVAGAVEAIVQVDGSWVLLDVSAGLVSGDGGTVAEGVGDVVDGTHATIGVTETVRAGHVAGTALLLAEGTAGGVVFVVTEGVVAVALDKIR